jgi:hypothetical protein
MTTRTLQSALAQYRLVVDKLAELQARHVAELAQLEATRTKIRSWLMECGCEGETHEWLVECDPALAWQVSEKSDGLAMRLHMLMDDVKIPEVELGTKDSIKPMKDAVESIENWALKQLLDRGAKNFSADGGTASLRTDVKYQIADKKLLVEDSIKNGYASELTITLRPNSKFAQQFVENSGYLMPGVSSFKEQKCIFTKR